ncbi:MAG: hypothetical protein IJ958_10695 [Agathobacter sp.]|nr:hypothetical protein [Agathobacter sp.]
MASRMRVEGENAFVDFMNQGQLQCTNAYISVNDKRALPMAASLMKVKNTNDEGRNLAAINVPEVEEKQLVQASNGYAVYYDGKIYTADINKQIRYHHSRPVDKGVGHVLANDDSQFYQIESLAEGQSFIGSIYGTNEQVKKVYELLTKDVNVRVGAGKNTEYGEAEITITALVECNEDTPKMAKRFVVKCNAATILYNEFGMYSTEKKDVEFAINALLGTDKAVTIQQEFVKCVEIGGYNVTWNAKKPTLLAIDKGSLFVCEVNEEIDLTKYNVAFIGERNSEGYGEITVEEVPEEYVVSYTKKTPKSTENIQQMSANTSKELSSMMYGLLKQDVKEDVEEIAIAKAVEMKKALKNEENINAIVNQLVLIQKQSDNETDFIKAIRARYDRDTQKKQHKQNVAFKLIEKANEKSPVDNVMENVVNKCEIRIEKDEVYQWYYKALLGQLKYYIREKGV